MNDGPCYDYCGCRYCWKGWTRMSRWWRIKNRIDHLVCWFIRPR